MNSRPLISVVVPFYNSCSTIERCINSVLLQSFNSFELILVDDGSTDSSLSLIDQIIKADDRVIVVHQQNSGVSVARNTGIKQASGHYITFCDADDYYGENWLADLYKDSHDVDIVFGNYKNIDDSDKLLKETAFLPGTYILNDKKDNLEFIVNKVFKKGCAWTVWSCLFKKDVIEQNDIRFNKKCLNFGEDLGFVLEFLLCSKTISISEADSYYYVTHSGSMSDNNNEVVRMDSLNEVSKSFYDLCCELGYDRYKNLLAIIHFLIMYGQYYKLIGKPNYSLLKNEIDKINDKSHYFNMTRTLMHSYKEMCSYTDKKTAKQILLFTNYCLHRNWERFKIESAIFYKFIKL